MTYIKDKWAEGSPGEHMVAMQSTDHGQSWSDFVDIEPYSNTTTKQASAAWDQAQQEMLTVFENDLTEVTDDLADMAIYSKKKHKLSSLAKGHAMQRCCDAETVLSPAIAGGGGGEGGVAVRGLRANAYRTKAKASKASAFSGIF